MQAGIFSERQKLNMKLNILNLKLKHLGMFNDNFFAKLEEENKEQESMRT